MKKLANKMTIKAFVGVATILSILAVCVVSTASVIYVYQGNTPNELLK